MRNLDNEIKEKEETIKSLEKLLEEIEKDLEIIYKLEEEAELCIKKLKL
ncbi:MAG: hypothetical protein RQ952_05945 [Thermoproteota archaeon]|jgi:hypothetical protein|nr:hypothetical protein [Thermoproteota archaeon]